MNSQFPRGIFAPETFFAKAGIVALRDHPLPPSLANFFPPRRLALPVAVLVITFLAPALAGSTQLWSEAVLGVLIGLSFLFQPPRRSLSQLPNFLFASLLLLALAAFLPASWFGSPDFRAKFVNFGVSLPPTLTPQPWLTFESICLLLLGLSWAYYLLAFDWPGEFRSKACGSFCFAILVLAATLIVACVTNSRVPFWPVQEFGFFPNRNQTGNVLGLAGIMIYAIGLHRLEQGRKDWWMWLAALSIICWALILNFSRAGIILFFGGALAWHLWWLKNSRGRKQRVVTLGALLFIIAILLVNGGRTLARFGAETANSLKIADAGRPAIYHDTLAVLAETPLLGNGLGNFPALFALHRHFSAASNEAIHPESDWLWMATGLGWLGPVVLLALFVWWVKQCLPLERGSFSSLRSAAIICGFAFAVHSLFDVSGHRLGALFPALFLASVAIYPRSQPSPTPRAFRVAYRSIGIILILISSWWFASIGGANVWPTTVTLASARTEARLAIGNHQYPAALQHAARGLEIAPMDWKLYFHRAAAEIVLSPSNTAARDFLLVRYLVPYWPEVCLEEGELWLAAGEYDLAFDAWAEALRRSPASAPDLYSRMFGYVKSDVTLQDRWRLLAHTDKNCLVVFLQYASPTELRIELDRLLSEDPELRFLTRKQLVAVFQSWYLRGDKLELAEFLQQHPKWQSLVWRQLARIYADYQDYRPAFETVQRFATPPNIPEKKSSGSLASLQRRFELTPTDVDAGLGLYFAQVKEGEIDPALATLQQLALLPGSPAYVSYLQAQLWARKGEWDKAWKALQQFEPVE